MGTDDGLGALLRFGAALHIGRVDRRTLRKQFDGGRWGVFAERVRLGELTEEVCAREERSLRALLRRYGESAVFAVVPGTVGGLVVDVDIDKTLTPAERVDAGREHGDAVVQAIGREPVARYATLSGGCHLWYAVRDAGEQRSASWRLDGMRGDIRGGYGALAAVYPPDGRDALAHLLELYDAVTLAEPVDAAAVLGPLEVKRDHRDRFAGTLAELARDMKDVGEGERNAFLNKAVYAKTLGYQADDAGLAAMRTAAIGSGLGEREVDATIASATAAALAHREQYASMELGPLTVEYPGEWRGRLHNYQLGERWLLADDPSRVCEVYAGLPSEVYRAIVALVMGNAKLNKTYSAQMRGINAVEARVKRANTEWSELLLKREPMAYERNSHLAGLPDGTVYDLRADAPYTGGEQHYVHRRLGAMVGARPSALWAETLEQIFGGDAAALDYFRRVAAYTLSGDASHHAIWFWVGTGANGKSLVASTLARAFGEYSTRVASEHVQRQSHRPHEAWKADLAYRRMAWVEEITGALDVEGLKELSGGSVVKARHLYRSPFEFRPVCKLHLLTNALPSLPGAIDYSVRRRVKVIRFAQQFAVHPEGGELRADPELPAKLARETAGVLRWLVDAYPRDGVFDLRETAAVKGESMAYLDDQDVIRAFVREDGRVMLERGSEIRWPRLKELYGLHLGRKLSKGDTMMLKRVLSGAEYGCEWKARSSPDRHTAVVGIRELTDWDGAPGSVPPGVEEYVA